MWATRMRSPGHPQRIPSRCLETIAECHLRDSIDLIQWQEFDPEMFLLAVVDSSDQSVQLDDRLHARRLLMKVEKQHSDYCVCCTTLVARNEFEWRSWIRDPGLEQSPCDAQFATVVRRVAAGDRPDPWYAYRHTLTAVETAVQQGVERVLGADRSSDGGGTRGYPPAQGPFWRTLLSTDTRVTPRQRLQAFVALDQADALHKCKCERIEEELVGTRADAYLGERRSYCRATTLPRRLHDFVFPRDHPTPFAMPLMPGSCSPRKRQTKICRRTRTK